MARKKAQLTDDLRKVIMTRMSAAVDYESVRDQLEGTDAAWFQSESERNLALVGGQYWQKREPSREMFSINHISPALQVKHTIKTGGKTMFLPKARNARFMPIADTAKQTLNHLWDIFDFDRLCDLAEWDSYIYRKGGVVELGWVYEDDGTTMRGDRPEDAVEALAEAALPQDAMPMMAGGEMVAPAPMMDGGMNLPPAEFGTDEQAEEFAGMPWDFDLPRPKRDDPFIERFSPADFFIDPQCTTQMLTDARYVFRKRSESLGDVRRNSKYHAKATP
jgi:hypothetical protein